MDEQGLNWEPQSVANIAEILSQKGEEFRNSLISIYDIFNALGTNQNWVGANFNVIANDVMNASISSFEEWINYLQVTIPETVGKIAIQQANAGYGDVEYSLTPASGGIKYIEETEQKADGSQILEPEIVRNAVNSTMVQECDNAKIILNSYVAQFQELGSLNGNAAMYTMADRLEDIVRSCSNVLDTFQEELENAVERSLAKTELTNEETKRIAEQLEQSLNV